MIKVKITELIVRGFKDEINTIATWFFDSKIATQDFIIKYCYITNNCNKFYSLKTKYGDYHVWISDFSYRWMSHPILDNKQLFVIEDTMEYKDVIDIISWFETDLLKSIEFRFNNSGNPKCTSQGYFHLKKTL